MSKTDLAAKEVEKVLRQIAAQARQLSEGLQHAAPGSVVAGNQSITYLSAIATELDTFANEIQSNQPEPPQTTVGSVLR